MTAVHCHELTLPTRSRHPRSRIRRPEAAGRTKATHPNVVPRCSAHIDRQASGLLRAAWLETVWAHLTRSPLCNPSTGNPGPSGAPDGAPVLYERQHSGHTTLFPLMRSSTQQPYRLHRSKTGAELPLHQGRVRLVPRVQHTGSGLPAAPLRRMRPR